MKPSLVIGAAGQVGERIVCTLLSRGQTVVQADLLTPSPDMRRLDIRQRDEVEHAIVSIQPDIVYLTAALTNVDYCEEHPEESYQVNVTGVQNVVDATNRAGARLVFFSSDYIFDGCSGPYHEDSTPCPICEYGRQKLLAEQLIARSSRNYLIIRTTVVYAWEGQGKNFVVRLLKALSDDQEVRVPLDQVSNPTYAPNLAEASIELAENNLQEVFHVVGPERASRYEFACEAARVFGYPVQLIRPITTRELNQPAARPLNAGMTIAKAKGVLKTSLIGFRAGLRLMEKTKGELTPPLKRGAVS